LENGAILEEVLSSEAPRRNQRSGQSYWAIKRGTKKGKKEIHLFPNLA
jgi:hypothetical protein